MSKRQKNVVAKDGIEPPTQAFSGLWLLEPVYFAPAKSSFLILQNSWNLSECAHIVPKKYDTIYILKNYE